MHPEIYRELISQRGRDMREQAHRAHLAKMVSRLRRSGRRGAATEPGVFIIPAIPDYVDGSFRTEPAQDQVTSEASQVPAARHAV